MTKSTFRYFKTSREIIQLAVDHEGEVLESYVNKTREKHAALRFLNKAMKRYGALKKMIADGLRSNGAAMKEIRNDNRQPVGRYLNNRTENSHLTS